MRPLRLRDVGHHLIGRRDGVGGGRVGERGALHDYDPIVLTIVVLEKPKPGRVCSVWRPPCCIPHLGDSPSLFSLPPLLIYSETDTVN